MSLENFGGISKLIEMLKATGKNYDIDKILILLYNVRQDMIPCIIVSKCE
jgi:hypothetical protein